MKSAELSLNTFSTRHYKRNGEDKGKGELYNIYMMPWYHIWGNSIHN